MKVYFILIFILLSCEIAPPNSSTGGGSSETSFQDLTVECDRTEICHDTIFEDAPKVIAKHFEGDCDGSIDPHVVLAQSSGELLCDSEVCSAKLSQFDKVKKKINQFKLLVFIDLNQNESIDIGEPYFCAEKLASTGKDKFTVLEIELVRLFEE